MSKNDYLKECMSDVSSKLGRMIPIDDFNKNFCVVCVNHDCARGASGLKFENRVNNWKSIYFDDVRRADENDPKFEHIRMKKFISPNNNTYVIQSDCPIMVNPVVPIDAVETAIVEQDTSQVDAPKVVVQKLPETPAPTLPASKANTEFNQGTMLTSDNTTINPGQVFVFDDE
jgi:hypothetical protein